MKLAFCVAIVAIVAEAHALTEKQLAQEIQFNNECTIESGAPEDLVYKFRRGDSVDDPKIRAYALCFFKKARFFDNSGNLLVDEIKKGIPQGTLSDAEFDKIVKGCTVKKDTPEQTAFDAYDCLGKL